MKKQSTCDTLLTVYNVHCTCLRFDLPKLFQLQSDLLKYTIFPFKKSWCMMMQELLSELATMMKMTTLTIMTTMGQSKQVFLGNRLAARCTSVLVTPVVLWCTEPVPMQGCFCHCLSSSLPVIVVVHAAEPSEKRDYLVSHRLFRSITCAVSIICILYLLQRHAGGDGQALPFSASLLPCFGLSC